MTEKEINKILNPQKKFMVLFLIYLIIALACIGLSFYASYKTGNRQYEDAVNINERIKNEEVLERRRIFLLFDKVPILIVANYEGENSLYSITDTENNIYLASISKETFINITKQIDLETGRLKEIYQIKGVSIPIDEKMEETVIPFAYKIVKNNKLNKENFSEYLGKVYLKEQGSRERVATLYYCIALFGVFFLILAFGYLLPGILKTRKSLKNKELLEKLRHELEKLTDTRYKKYHIYLTQNYIISGVQAVKYEDIKEGYVEVESKYGIKVGENLLIKTKDNEILRVGSVAGNSNVLHEVLKELHIKNQNIQILTNQGK